jgi:hypothetical protein
MNQVSLQIQSQTNQYLISLFPYDLSLLIRYPCLLVRHCNLLLMELIHFEQCTVTYCSTEQKRQEQKVQEKTVQAKLNVQQKSSNETIFLTNY